MAKDGLTAEAAAAAEGMSLVDREAWLAGLRQLRWDGFRPGRPDARVRRLRYFTGRAVRHLRGRAPAREVAAYLAAHLEEIAP
jgi:hypothetical protein